MMKKVLEIRHLNTEFSAEQGTVQAVRDVSLDLYEGEILGVVGESGSGKSVTMYSIMGLLAENGRVTGGEIKFKDRDISRCAFPNNRQYEDVMQTIQGKEIGMIFQDPMTFLNPVLRIETQLVEPLLNHTGMTRSQASQRAVELLRQVGIPSPETRIHQYPHQFSGGMRQRIVIAIALACNPGIIIADEPTTALDVTIQAQILELISSLRSQNGRSVIMITHDLGVVASLCDRIAIMYGGKIVEVGSDREIFYTPKHPYTKGLLKCVTNPDKNDTELEPIPGTPPDLLHPPAGCPFVDRCGEAMRICKVKMPPKETFSETQCAYCWHCRKEKMSHG